MRFGNILKENGLSSLKVGDTVIRAVGSTAVETRKFVKITGETEAYWIVGNEKFKKIDGKTVGGGKAYIMFPNDTLIKEVNKINYVNFLSAFKDWGNLSYETLKDIYNKIKK